MLTMRVLREEAPRLQSVRPKGEFMSVAGGKRSKRRIAITLASATVLAVTGSVPLAYADGGGHPGRSAFAPP